MFQGFIHPFLVWGTALAAVPLLIHIFNRQRHKPLPWAAMRFVLAAYKKTRRRAQLENFLLLLLRMAAIALLALALSRPFTGAESALAPLTESRRDMALVLDASASTGYRENVRSVYEAILDRARALLEDFDGTRGDRIRLFASSSRPRLLSARSPEDALALLPTLGEPTDEPLDLAATLAEVVAFAEEEAAGTTNSSIEVRLLTDMQRGTFEPDLTPSRDTGDPEDTGDADEAGDAAASAVARLLDRLDELSVRVLVEDLGGGVTTPPNVGIQSVAPIGELYGAGLASDIGVRVRNHGPMARGGVRVALEVGGVRQPSQTLDVPARSTVEAVFSVPFSSPGSHTVVARLEGDRLAIDDSVAAVVEIPAPIRVLLVNGDSHPAIDRDEVGYLRAVLDPPTTTAGDTFGAASASPFVTREIDAATIGTLDTDLDDFDVIVLANVGAVSARVVTALEERVAAGGMLLFTMGDRTSDPSAIDHLNARFWNATGSGLLPAKLFRAVEVPSRREAYYRCTQFDEEHPVLEFFADERWRPFLTEVPVYAFVASEEIENATVLARLDDEAKSPLLAEREFGRGRVFLWATSIDRDWSRVAESPSTLIPLVHELFRYAGRMQRPSRNVRVGDTIALEVDRFPRSSFVVHPDGSRRPLDGEPTEVSKGLWALPPIVGLDRAGLWRLEHEDGQIPFSVAIDPEEGDLERIGADELTNQHRVWRVVDPSSGEEEDEAGKPERGELWRWLAGLALAALIGETLLTAWISRSRRLA